MVFLKTKNRREVFSSWKSFSKYEPMLFQCCLSKMAFKFLILFSSYALQGVKNIEVKKNCSDCLSRFYFAQYFVANVCRNETFKKTLLGPPYEQAGETWLVGSLMIQG